MKTDAHSPQQGQILVLFALVLVASVAMVGLVIDGGSAYAQRRGQQNAADLAALAGADALINTQAVTQAATDVATSNGYTADGDTTVTVTTDASAGTVKVDITAPHRNYFAGVVGMPTWSVSVTATAIGGVPTGVAAAPIIFSAEAFDENNHGLPFAAYGCTTPPCPPFGFGDGNGDVPNNPGDVAWTLYGPNLNTSDVRPYLNGKEQSYPAFGIGDYIGQSNGGFHNALFGDGTGVADPVDCAKDAKATVDSCLSGKDVIVPIVGPGPCNGGGHPEGGCFEGWALFHVVSADGANSKTIQGYFVQGFSRGGSSTDVCTSGSSCAGFHGLYVVKLIN